MPSRVPESLRFLLLQVRNADDPMQQHEQLAFARALEIDAERCEVLDLLATRPSPAQLDANDVVLAASYNSITEKAGHPYPNAPRPRRRPGGPALGPTGRKELSRQPTPENSARCFLQIFDGASFRKLSRTQVISVSSSRIARGPFSQCTNVRYLTDRVTPLKLDATRVRGS